MIRDLTDKLLQELGAESGGPPAPAEVQTEDQDRWRIVLYVRSLAPKGAVR